MGSPCSAERGRFKSTLLFGERAESSGLSWEPGMMPPYEAAPRPGVQRGDPLSDPGRVRRRSEGRVRDYARAVRQ